jgi:hypothetical protein
LILKHISGYPAGTVDSGIIICQLPEQLLTGESKFLSFATLMSCERVKPDHIGIAALDTQQTHLHKLPLIYELIEIAIQKGICTSSADFLHTYFIDAYFQAIEPICFKEGYSLIGEAHNLYVVLNPDHTIKGFAYRDLGRMKFKQKCLESYSWFYRYTNFVKLLNVLIQSESGNTPPPLGAPIRAGTEKPSSERNLYRYLYMLFDKEKDFSSLEALQRLSITLESSLDLLQHLDSAYLALLKRYFAIDEASILNSDGTLPCAEKGSFAETGQPHSPVDYIL